MSIKARPFRTQVGDVEVEGFFEDESFVFRFHGVVTFRPLVTSVGEDERGKFAILQETEISQPDGFVLTLETNYDSDLQCEWGYLVTLKRIEPTERDLFNSLLKLKGVDPSSVNLIIPPKQLISVYFDPRGVKDGSAQLHPSEPGDPVQRPETGLATDRIQLAAAKRILFLSHAVRQMSRADRMITSTEVRNIVESGEVIEDYPEDPRGPSCLVLGYGEMGRPIHVVCSPKPDFLAIITAYLPSEDEWSDDFRMRTKR
jgi:hypothetical protein